MLQQDQQRLIGCLLIAIPISYLLGLIKKAASQLLLTCSASIFLQYIVFRQWIIVLWIQQNIVYVLCKYGNRKVIGRAIFLQTFIVLSIVQIVRMYLSYGIQSIDITAIMMMQSFQYISFAFNYQDGMKAQANQYKIIHLPPYAEYLGYVSFVPTCLIGPFLQFNDFHHYLYRTGIYKDVQAGFSIPAVRKELKKTILSIAVYVLFIPFPLSKMITTQYEDFSFLLKGVYLLISIFGARFKYYGIWSLGMLGVHATGLTYNPKKNQFGRTTNDWDRVETSNIWDFELNPGMQIKSDGWNISIQTALKRYIYDRINKIEQNVSKNQRKRVEEIANRTKLVIYALWHGLYPGYWIAFFHWALWLQISQQVQRLQKEWSKLKSWRKKLYYIELLVINYFIGYFGVCYQLMSLQKIELFLRTTLYIPLIITYIANIIIVRFGLFRQRQTKKMENEKEKEKGEQKEKSRSNRHKQEKVQ